MRLLALAIFLLFGCTANTDDEVTNAIEIIVRDSKSVIIAGKEVNIEDFESELEANLSKRILKKDSVINIDFKVASHVKMSHITEIMLVLRDRKGLKITYQDIKDN